jgi:hypothetical protein
LGDREAPLSAAATHADPGDNPEQVLERLESSDRVHLALGRLGSTGSRSFGPALLGGAQAFGTCRAP